MSTEPLIVWDRRSLEKGFGSKRHVSVLTINRPSALNALNGAVIAELGRMIRDLSADPELAGVVITGSGEKAFVAGADIKELSQLIPTEARRFAERGQALFRQFAVLPVPVVAAVNGFALGGGCELALACDWIYASPNAKFGLPEASLGLIPGFGGTVRLARRIGSANALEWTLSGQPYSAEDSHRLGLVQKVVPLPELIQSCVNTISLVAQRGPEAVARIKRSIHEGLSLNQVAHEAFEAQLFGQCFGGSESREGTSAFIEKRAPQFGPRRGAN